MEKVTRYIAEVNKRKWIRFESVREYPEGSKFKFPWINSKKM